MPLCPWKDSKATQMEPSGAEAARGAASDGVVWVRSTGLSIVKAESIWRAMRWDWPWARRLQITQAPLPSAATVGSKSSAASGLMRTSFDQPDASRRLRKI